MICIVEVLMGLMLEVKRQKVGSDMEESDEFINNLIGH
jgi:hypothetical protein